jgi:hypothetical protein
MNKRFLAIFVLFVFLSLFLSPHEARKAGSAAVFDVAGTSPPPQTVKKTDNDYMSSILSRNTKPLGLKENLPLRKFLNQPSFKWALRSGGRQILD